MCLNHPVRPFSARILTSGSLRVMGILPLLHTQSNDNGEVSISLLTANYDSSLDSYESWPRHTETDENAVTIRCSTASRQDESRKTGIN